MKGKTTPKTLFQTEIGLDVIGWFAVKGVKVEWKRKHLLRGKENF